MLGLLEPDAPGKPGYSFAGAPEAAPPPPAAPEAAAAKTLDARPVAAPGQETAASDDVADEATQESGAHEEYEIVLGRRQIAGWLFLGIVVVGVASTLAYLAGRVSVLKPGALASTASTNKPAPSIQPVVTAVPGASMAPPALPPVSLAGAPAGASVPGVAPAPGPSPAPPPAVPGAVPAAVPARLPEATILRIPDAPVKNAATGRSMFAEPETGKVYLQIGAVSKGMAVILTEGLRSHGFISFIAPGPSSNVFRVLIGPLPDQQAYNRAKAEVDAIDLTNFARRYQK